jgi:hypothetical protein
MCEALMGFNWFPGVGMRRYDKFGLPLTWGVLETEEERAERTDRIGVLLREVYETAVCHLGPQLAKEAWRSVIRGTAGRPKGRRMNKPDAILLAMYDAAMPLTAEKRRSSLPRLIAERAKEQKPQDYPISVGSIESRLRRLLKSREAERAATAEAYRYLATAMPGPGLLDILSQPIGADEAPSDK